MRERPILRSQRQRACVSESHTRLAQARAHRPPGARNMALAKLEAGGKIEHRRAALLLALGQFPWRDRAPWLEARGDLRARASLECPAGKSVLALGLEHIHFAPA